MRKLLLAGALMLASAPAASADPWPLCTPKPVRACIPICFGTHDNWQCIPPVE